MARSSWLLLILCGCPAPRPACDRNRASTVELRDGSGALLLAAKPGERGSLDLCDAGFMRVGAVKEEPAALTLLDRGGGTRLVFKKDGPNDGQASSADGLERLRVHREGEQLFILDPAGVRLGMVAKSSDKIIFYDRQQTPAGSVEPRGPDQVIRDPDGKTLLLVIPAASSQAAGVFTVAGLDPQEQLALYLLLSR
jgi:hypothetical protein